MYLPGRPLIRSGLACILKEPKSLIEPAAMKWGAANILSHLSSLKFQPADTNRKHLAMQSFTPEF